MNTGTQRAVLSLGLVASSKRKILDGTAFAPLFPKTVSTDPFFTQNGTVHDTVDYCIKIVKSTLADTKAITRYLAAKSKTKDEFCKNLFDFTYNHYQYQIDKSGVEQLRRPARAFKDRKQGIDCDCFAITCGSILHNANIDFYFRIVKMFSRDYYQHIYVVVPKFKGADMTNKNNYFTIDPVLDKYNVEAPGITQKKDKIMSAVNGMPIQFLNGTDTVRLGEEFNGIGEDLGDFTMEGELEGAKRFNDDYLRRKKVHLINTRKLMDKDPRRFQKIYDLPKLKAGYEKLITAWDNENTRNAMLDHLSGIEEEVLRPELQGLGYIIHGTDDELLGLMGVEFDGTETLEGKIFKAKKASTAPATKKTGVFTKIKNATKTVATKVATLKTKEGRQAAVKKIVKAVVKYNPATVAIRLGFLAGLKTNFMQIASRLYWGYFPYADAKKAGVTESYWKKAVQALKQQQATFEKLGGSADAMKQAILSGRASKKAPQSAAKGKLRGIDGLLGIEESIGELGEPVTAAAITAGLTALTAAASSIGKLFKKSNGKEETETGGETAPLDVPNAPKINNDADGDGIPDTNDESSDGSPSMKPSKTLLLVGGAAIAAGALYLATRPKEKKEKAVAGTEKSTKHKSVKLS